MIDKVNYYYEKSGKMSELKLLESMFQLVHQLKRQILEQSEVLDMNLTSMHVRVLKVIKMKPNCTANDIAKILSRDKAQVTRLLNSLIEQNLIKKVPNPEDKRSQRLLTTDNAEDIFNQIKKVDATVVEKLTKGFTEQECVEFQRMLNKINKNLH